MCPKSGKLLPIPIWTERKDTCGPCSAKYRKNRLSSIAMSHPQLLRQRPQKPLPNAKHNSGFAAEPCCERRSCCVAEPTRCAPSRCASRGKIGAKCFKRQHEASRSGSTSAILNGPQGTQRGLLRLGQAPDPRDIEPLVLAVASQCAQMLGTLQLPDVDGPVIVASGQPAPIGTAPERPDHPLMGFLHPHALPAVHLPPAQHPVTASTDHQLPTASPGQRRDHPRMPRPGAITCPPG